MGDGPAGADAGAGRAGGGRYAAHLPSAPTSGQSLAEFAIVLPLLILILVAVADFARVFTAVITLEAAARDAAEIAAQEYRRTAPSPLPDPGDPNYYRDISRKAALVACAEARQLPNTTYDTSTGECPTWPVIRVCVHDGVADNQCGNPINGFRQQDPDCTRTDDPMVADRLATGYEPSRYVEVRLCYQFTMLLRLPPLPMDITPPIGDIYIERARSFTVADY